MKTWGQSLTEVQEAITAVMSGQKYELGGRMLQRPDLTALQAREKYLIDKLNTDCDVLPFDGTIQNGVVGVSFV